MKSGERYSCKSSSELNRFGPAASELLLSNFNVSTSPFNIEHSIIITSQTGQSRKLTASQPLETQDTMSFWTYVSTYPKRSKNEELR